MATRAKVLFLMVLLIALIFLLFETSPVLAQNATNPGDSFIFRVDSPVFADSNIQSYPSLSENIAMWQESETYYPYGPDDPRSRYRLYYKDLSQGTDAPSHVLIEDQLAGGRSAISRDFVAAGKKRVVFTETVQMWPRLFYMDFDFAAGTTCTDFASCGATQVYTGTTWQSNPVISPDGTKIAWEDRTNSNSRP